MLPDV
jgi:hypothetical protein